MHHCLTSMRLTVVHISWTTADVGSHSCSLQGCYRVNTKCRLSTLYVGLNSQDCENIARQGVTHPADSSCPWAHQESALPVPFPYLHP